MLDADDTLEVPAGDFTAEDVALAESVRHMLIDDLLKAENAAALRAFAYVALLEQIVSFCLASGRSVTAVRAMTAGELAASHDLITKRGTDG